MKKIIKTLSTPVESTITGMDIMPPVALNMDVINKQTSK